MCSSGQEGREIPIWPLRMHWTTLKLALLEWPTKKGSFIFFFHLTTKTYQVFEPCGIKDQKMMGDVCNTSQAHRLKVCENVVLRRIIGPKKGKCGENCILSSSIIYTSPNTVRFVKSWMWKWPTCAVCVGDVRTEFCSENLQEV